MTITPSLHQRVHELVVVVQGLRMEVEATRKQVSYIGEITQDLLRSVMKFQAERDSAPIH